MALGSSATGPAETAKTGTDGFRGSGYAQDDFLTPPPEPTAAARHRNEIEEQASEFVMGPRQIAVLGFVGILIVGLVSAIAYFAGRKTPQPALAVAPPPVVERIVERVVTAPAPASAAAPVAAPAERQPAPAPAALVTAAVQTAAPNTSAASSQAHPITPTFNKLYLQLGSVEPGIAEVMVNGLRQKGIPAQVGLGIHPTVARVLVGPIESSEERQMLQHQVEALGFKPFPRIFNAQEFAPAPPAPPAPAPAPTPTAKP